MSVWFLSLSVYVYGIYGIATVVEGKYELKRSKRHKYCKKAINFPTDFSLAHCGKEISLKDPKLRLAGAGGA